MLLPNLHYIPREDLIDLSISPGGTDKFDQLSPYLEKILKILKLLLKPHHKNINQLINNKSRILTCPTYKYHNTKKITITKYQHHTLQKKDTCYKYLQNYKKHTCYNT